MTHTYKISGMTCNGCLGKVQSLLSTVNGVSNVNIDLQKGEAAIDMTQHVPTVKLKDALKEYPEYQLAEATHQLPPPAATLEEDSRSWLPTYKPVILIFAYLTGITLLLEGVGGSFSLMRWMNHFMGGFFLVFSFFKLLNLGGFAESYGMYDILAKRWQGWGYIYPFVELGLGVAFLISFEPLVTNAVTLVVMGVSIVGVLQSVLHKRKIKCACLGDVFNLPMSTITIIEDALMIGMSAFMLLSLV
jgi:copper chaperone CopZ